MMILQPLITGLALLAVVSLLVANIFFIVGYFYREYKKWWHTVLVILVVLMDAYLVGTAVLWCLQPLIN